MFKTQAFVSEKLWGYERWTVSTHAAGQCIVDEKAEFIGGKTLSSVTGEYPLLIKIIQANETLSVQVHPDDEYARIHENGTGKTECWYILDAKPGASLIYGLNGSPDRIQLRRAIKTATLDNYLRSVQVAKGDFVFIPAGTVHAIKGGLRLLEIQQSSDITYRLYDWGRSREVHIEKGLDVIKPENNASHSLPKPFGSRFVCPYFTLEKKDYTISGNICFAKELTPEQKSAFETPAAQTGWVSLCILSGSGILESNTGERFGVKTEDCIMLRTEEHIRVIPEPNTLLSIMEIG